MTLKKQNASKSDQPNSAENGGVYEIKIRGFLDNHWQQWFEGMTLQYDENAEAGQGYTFIIGQIADQPALHGLLAKIRDLNLTLISVRRIAPNDLDSQGRDQNGKK
jgi:hypothetical protein